MVPGAVPAGAPRAQPFPDPSGACRPERRRDWTADSGNQWTVPLGGGIGHIFHLGRLPVNAQIGGYYNVVAPDNGADWQLRAQIQLMFPK